MIGKLEPVPLREVWSHEARDFSSWLYNNLDILNDQIGLKITPIETEKSVGTFSVDILAEDNEGKLVIIENQLEKTDHDHLGKILTYLSNLEAKTAIWVSSNPRPEHQNAINYLNEVVPDDTNFYLVKVEAFKINQSEPAPLFSIAAGPSPELKEGGKIKKEIAGNEAERFEFFNQLLDKSNQKIRLFDNVSAQGYQSWLGAGSGRSGISWNYVVRNSDSRVEMFFQSNDGNLNKSRFEFLQNLKAEIEEKFGGPLDWDYRANRKQHYIRSWCNIGGLKQRENWDEIQKDLVSKMKSMVDSIGPYIQQLP
ncbi:MAG: DUF4268 domain-containing protein [Nitrospinales bacterium]